MFAGLFLSFKHFFFFFTFYIFTDVTLKPSKQENSRGLHAAIALRAHCEQFLAFSPGPNLSDNCSITPTTTPGVRGIRVCVR